jgi:membrane-associated phospholipid phosphatase
MSFTSGHSEFVITFWGLMLYLFLLRVTHGGLRVLLTASWLALVACVVVGRLHEGAHWPLDVVGGLAVGAGLLSGLVWLRRHLVASSNEPA